MVLGYDNGFKDGGVQASADLARIALLPDHEKRRELERMRSERRRIALQRAALEVKYMSLEHEKEALDGILTWMEATPNKLEAARGSAWHKFMQAHTTGQVKWAASVAQSDIALIDAHPQVFVVEHNWAAAFAGAADFDAGEVRLPFGVCCFEFRISGKRLLVIQADDDALNAVTAFEAGGMWVAVPRRGNPAPEAGAAQDLQDCLGPLNDLIAANIRAICVALDAEVAEAPIVRAPHKLNRAREKRGELPLVDYHVVSLRNHNRPAPLADHAEGRRVRLHFRRGHWRHYEAHKTWIKWTLVGNPDLGFIDKHYKL